LSAQPPRRKFLRLLAGAAALPVLTHGAAAADYPSRPVRLIVPYPAGGAPDIVARLICKWLSERFGEQFIVDNRTGAGGNLGTEMVARAAPDGYTLLHAVSTNVVNVTLYEHLNYNFIRDLAPIGMIATVPFALLIYPGFPAKTLGEFIAYAKANPGKVNMATQGIGTTPHICGELLQMMTGIRFVHVPYRVNLMPDLLAGQVHIYFSPLPQAIAFIKDGRLRTLGVTTTARAHALPDVPAIAEVVPGYEALGWHGLCAPKDPPGEVVTTLNGALAAAVTDPDMKTRLDDLGVTPMRMTPVEFSQFIIDETEKWAKVIKFANIRME
jgi:tripartite-type tricarboxylate transporter receptor subunit TctC